jgi:glycosyltransferase involved in cell wall biosynthesis
VILEGTENNNELSMDYRNIKSPSSTSLHRLLKHEFSFLPCIGPLSGTILTYSEQAEFRVRIAIDARMISPGSMHGIARYVFELLKCLTTNSSGHSFFVIVNPGSPLQALEWPDHIKVVEVLGSWISLKQQWELPKVLKALKADLFHAPSFMAPLACPCRMVMTIHDLNHMVLPQFYTPFHQFYYQVFVRSCIRRSKYILTVSHFSKEEIVRNLNISSDKVFVTYNGVSDSYRPIVDRLELEYVRELYELPERFIFCLSNNKPHKNVHQLVRAYCHANISIPLVLACPVDASILRTAETYGKKHLIYFSKFIAEEHLPSVYSMTHLFVYPSTYEGFGLPPLEALSCGAPVVVARSSSLPEVVGDSAIFANPFDYQDIARALEIGVNDTELRARLRDYGVTHARRFSWESMTQETLEIYERCHSSVSSQPAISTEQSMESP